MQKETVGLNRGAAVPTRVDDKPTLAPQGIDKNLAHQARVGATGSSDNPVAGARRNAMEFSSCASSLHAWRGWARRQCRTIASSTARL